MYGMMFVALTPCSPIAAIVMTFILSFGNLFSGFFIPRPKMVAEPTKEHVDVADTEPVASSTDNVEKTKKKIKKGVFLNEME
ncbi:hypothetical protein KY290_007948 [Solanum tuberosum]|uniref:ABC-2 type transporter transmembrane domain-containing protein n=1 Tax=Solanum tuberosum TaxID=4113 RepID=A0ABQ7W9Q0_SOLTU|nr:hypothetical protein KY290_007948 [Solanum tuberosum]